MSKKEKLPAIHLYPGDWLRDSICGCSLEAQGLWLRMMFVMHDSERYGFLCQNGKPLPKEVITRRCGCTIDEFNFAFDLLLKSGVPSITEEGIIYSRRMEKDAKISPKTFCNANATAIPPIPNPAISVDTLYPIFDRAARITKIHNEYFKNFVNKCSFQTL